MRRDAKRREGRARERGFALVFLGGLVLGAGILLGLIRILFPDAQKIEVSLPEGKSVHLKIEKSRIELAKILEGAFGEPGTREAVLAHLRRHQVFHLGDPGLADAVADLLPDDPHEPIGARVQRLNRLISSYSVLADLRERADARKPPFQPTGRVVRIGAPQPDWPTKFRAYVPFESELEGRRIEIVNPRNDRRLVLLGKGAFHKVDNVDIQLNWPQAIHLFYEMNQSTSEAVVFVLPGPGELRDPTGDGPIRVDSRGF